jgi:hypothetical protein
MPKRRLLRNSERKAYLTCRQMWWWGYVKRLQSKQPKAALHFGSLVHESLEEWYIPGRKRGRFPHLAFQERLGIWEAENGEFTMPDGTKAMDLGTAMLKGYVNHWGKDERYEVIAPEMKFQVPALDSNGDPIINAQGEEVWHVGTGDAIIRDLQTKQIGVMETKTAAAIDTKHLGRDDQASSYWTMFPLYLQSLGILKRGEDINFLMYNFLRKALPSDRPRDAEGHYLNKDGTISKNQPSPLFHREPVWRGGADRRRFLQRINNVAVEIGLAEAGRLPIIKNPSSAYPDKHCEGCQFRDMCDIHEMGSDWQEYARNTMTFWDPYEEHKEKEE